MQPDILHSNVIFPAGIIGHNLAAKLKIPHVITEHWTRLDKFLKTSIYAKQAIKSYKEAASVLPVSKFLKNKIAGYTNREENINVVPNVIDSNIFKYYKKTKNKPDSKVFIAIASWNYTKEVHKRPDLILNSISEANKILNKSFELIIIGSGNMIPSMKETAKQLKLNVNFTGIISKEDIAKNLQEADYFIHASNTETFCVVLAEALKTGTPSLVSNIEAIPELITEKSGILTENSVDSWVKTIEKAEQTDFNFEEIAKYYSKKFTYDSIGAIISEIYRTSV